MEQSKARILVVEDDPAISRGLCDVLIFNGYGADGVADGIQGCASALSGKYDLVLLDVMLPGMDGFSICREIRRKRPVQPVIILTAKGSEDDLIAGFSAGADDYVSKPFSIRELMVRVEAVLRRSGTPTGDEKIEYGDVQFDGTNLRAADGKRSVELTRKEMDIVVYLYRHQDRIVSKGELLTQVWHYKDSDIQTRTVDIHMLKLRKKIRSLVHGNVTIQTVRGQGYRLERLS